MSIVIIEDAKGGNKTSVDDHGRLYTKSDTIPHMAHHASYHNTSFACGFDTVLAGSSESYIAHIENNNESKEYEIHWITCSSDAAVEFNMYFGATYSSGGESGSLVNLYVGSGKTASELSYSGGASGDLTLTTTLANKFAGVHTAAGIPWDFQVLGGVVIPPGETMSISAIGAATNKCKVLLGMTTHTAGG